MKDNYISEEQGFLDEESAAEPVSQEVIEELPIQEQPESPKMPAEALPESPEESPREGIPEEILPEEAMLPFDEVPEVMLPAEPAEDIPDAEITAEPAEEIIETEVPAVPFEGYFEESAEVPETEADTLLVAPELENISADHDAMIDAGLVHHEDAEYLYPENTDALPTGPLPTVEEILNEELPPAPTPRERPARKGRPRRPKGYGLFSIPHMIATVIWLLVILAAGVTLGRMIWVCAADVLAFNRESSDVTVSITRDDTMDTIAEKLRDAGLIRYPELFKLYADLTNAEKKMTTGTFTLNTVYDYNALVKQMTPSSNNRVIVEDVLIPEGYSCRQIFERLEEKGVCSVEDLEEYAASGELGDYWFLEGIERGDRYCLEGFLFPATYDFYENSTPKQVLTKMLDAFSYNVNEEIVAQIDTLNETLEAMMRSNGDSEEYIAAHEFDLYDVLIVASLIEEETSGSEESPKIASVIYNRLFSWGSNPRYLNIDASIIYALDGNTDLTAENMAVDSPYNTYLFEGLTPGPITNPGIASIKAALEPASTSYYYYVLDPSAGTHVFSKTYEEHQKNIEKLGY